MRQVTGRSSKNSENKASIRLASGGRFFSASTLSSIAESGDVLVCIDTPRVTLIPDSMASSITAEQALSIVGLAPQSGEIAIYSHKVEDRCAAIAINSNAYGELSKKFGNRLKFTTPLLSNSQNVTNHLAIEISNGVCYLRLYTPGLKLAEALEIETADELLFYVINFFEYADISRDIPIYIIGGKEYVKLLKKYYKVICE